MGYFSLKGLCTLFSNTSKEDTFEKVPKEPLTTAVPIIKAILEQSDNPEWNALAPRLETYSPHSSGSKECFLYPLSNNDIFVRKSILPEFNQACIDILKTNIDPKQRDKVWDALLQSSEILHGKQEVVKPSISGQKNRPSQPELSYKPL